MQFDAHFSTFLKSMMSVNQRKFRRVCKWNRIIAGSAWNVVVSRAAAESICLACVLRLLTLSQRGINHGKTAGRFCWTIEGTLCPGTEEERIEKCSLCPFYLKVQQEEGVAFVQELGMLNI